MREEAQQFHREDYLNMRFSTQITRKWGIYYLEWQLLDNMASVFKYHPMRAIIRGWGYERDQ